MQNPHTPGRNIIVVAVLLLAIILPVVIAFGYLQDTPTISAGAQIETATQSVMPWLASETPSPAPPTRVINTANPARGNNCTYPATYWLVSPEKWPKEITIGNLYYTQDQAIDFITARPTGAFNILFIQLHAAYMNIVSGASQSQIVDALIEASDWLDQATQGSVTGQSQEARALYLAKIIQSYNDGESGPGRCPMETGSLELFSKNIPAAALSLTPEITTQAVTATTDTAGLHSPQAFTRTPAFIFPPSQPTATRTPTQKSDSGPPAPPTSPPPTAQPTATTAPPTPRPTSPPPTATPRPPEPTPTSAPPEEPTPTSPPP